MLTKKTKKEIKKMLTDHEKAKIEKAKLNKAVSELEASPEHKTWVNDLDKYFEELHANVVC